LDTFVGIQDDLVRANAYKDGSGTVKFLWAMAC